MEFSIITTLDYSFAQINHSLSCIQWLHGDLFCLLNSKWDVVVPDYEDPDWLIFVLHKVYLEHFFKPYWYTRRTGYLSFLTLWPINTGYSFDRLAGMPVPQLVDGMYLLDEERSALWSGLEQHLIWAMAYLKDVLQYFTDCPFAPWAFSYDSPAPFCKVLNMRAQLSRDWSQAWITLLSFLIAICNNNIEPHDAFLVWSTSGSGSQRIMA